MSHSLVVWAFCFCFKKVWRNKGLSILQLPWACKIQTTCFEFFYFSHIIESIVFSLQLTWKHQLFSMSFIFILFGDIIEVYFFFWWGDWIFLGLVWFGWFYCFVFRVFVLIKVCNKGDPLLQIRIVLGI